MNADGIGNNMESPTSYFMELALEVGYIKRLLYLNIRLKYEWIRTMFVSQIRCQIAKKMATFRDLNNLCLAFPHLYPIVGKEFKRLAIMGVSNVAFPH